MKKRVFLGIDTSNYTTSCSFCDENGVVLDNFKILLPVKKGENGLRQSDAVFAHVKNFQEIATYIREKHDADYEIVAVGYSKYPRDVENSYMPCFLVGRAIAEMGTFRPLFSPQEPKSTINSLLFMFPGEQQRFYWLNQTKTIIKSL